MKKVKLCIICGKNEATIPDRNQNNIGRLINKICKYCHAERLKGDVQNILQKHRQYIGQTR